MNDRTILEQRVATLDGLLDGTGQLLGPAGATLGEKIRTAWTTERQLLRRLLLETPGDDVRATIDLWRARTSAFLARSDDDHPAWTDKHGQRWEAARVLDLLDDATDRLDSWARSSEPLDDEQEP